MEMLSSWIIISERTLMVGKAVEHPSRNRPPTCPRAEPQEDHRRVPPKPFYLAQGVCTLKARICHWIWWLGDPGRPGTHHPPAPLQNQHPSLKTNPKNTSLEISLRFWPPPPRGCAPFPQGNPHLSSSSGICLIMEEYLSDKLEGWKGQRPEP